MWNNNFKIFNFKLKIRAKRNGFGLIETLIASGIIALIATATAGLSASIIRGGAVGDDKITASALAGEAIEITHLIRDHNISDSAPDTSWNSGLMQTNTDTSSCDPADDYLETYSYKVTPKRGRWNNWTTLPSTSEFTFTSGSEIISWSQGVKNTKTYRRNILFCLRDTSPDIANNILEIRSIVYRLNEAGTYDKVADLSSLITNWKE